MPKRTSKGAITISIERFPIVDVTYHGDMPAIDEYEESFREFALICEAKKPTLWLLDMRKFNPLGVDATTRKAASEVFHRYYRQLRPVSVAEARVTQDRLTRFVLTAFDWLTISNKWPCSQFAEMSEAEAWLWEKHRKFTPR